MREWRDIPILEGAQASNDGRIRLDGVELPILCSAGYRSVDIAKRHYYVHRLVAFAFHGFPPTPQHMALHKNDIRRDNTATNIYWGTHADNTRDAIANGKYRRTKI
jgi:hypothetical protein